jgi:acetolactate synthase I/II/III large subunit
VYGRHPDYPTTPLDVCTVAAGLGATTLRIDSVSQIEAARGVLRDTRGPVVVDVRIDPEVALPKKDRVAAMAPNAVVHRQPPKYVN